jgi:hypothetical protein
VAYDDYFGGVKAPTLRQQGAYDVKPDEIAFKRPAPPEPPYGAIPPDSGRTRVQKVKDLRTEFPRLSLREAVDIVDGNAPRPDAPKTEPLVELSDAELKAARKAARSIHANKDVLVTAVIDAINKVRSNDKVGTLRKSVAGQYAFSVEPGQYLLIEVGDNPRFRAADAVETADIKRSWALVASG